METETNQTESPRVRFHWSRSVRCLSKKVYLILTSISGTHICLSWKKGSGWFESDYVQLPPGLYTGYISIREKRKLGFFETSEEITERHYNVDPFFVTSQRLSIELFIETSNIQGTWKEVQGSVRRHAISQPSVSLEPPNQEEVKTKWSSSFELGRSSEAELKVRSELEHHQSSPDLSFNSYVQSKSEENLKEIVDDQRLAEIKEIERQSLETSYSHSQQKDSTNLRRWSSARQGRIDDSSLAGESDHSSHLEKDRELDDIEQNFALENQQNFSLGSPKHENSSIDTKEKYIFKEIDPVQGSIDRGYGCLITFESRSTSMDDLGSPRNLENVLVSLSSNDTDNNKNSANFNLFNPTAKISEILEASDFTENIEVEHPFRLSIHGSFETNDTDSKYPESDLTINEDENFVYDSLKNDDQQIPLNFQNLSGNEDSLEYQHPPPKPKRTFQANEIDLHLQSLITKKRPVSSSFELIDPGSLRSGSNSQRNKSDDSSIDDKDHTPSEIDLFEAVDTVRKLSYTIQPLILPPEPLEASPPVSKVQSSIKPKMSSTGTQTYPRDVVTRIAKNTIPLYNRRLKKEQAQLSDDSYSPLPCKVQGPWLPPKYQHHKTSNEKEKITAKSILKTFKKNFQNLEKAEKIARPYAEPTSSSYEFHHPAYRDKPNNHYLRYQRNAYSSPSSSYSPKHSHYVHNSSSYSSPSLRSHKNQWAKRQQVYYEVPTSIKEVPTPLISIYGQQYVKDFKRLPNQIPPRHTRGSRNSQSRDVLQPTFSLPNLRDCLQLESPILTVSQKYKIRSCATNNVSQQQPPPSRRSRKKTTKTFEQSKRRRHKSYDQSRYTKEYSSSGGSTESLIEEAYNLRRNSHASADVTSDLGRPRVRSFEFSFDDNKSHQRKSRFSRSRSFNRESTSETGSTDVVRRKSTFVPYRDYEEEEEVSRSLKTRSETDLRLIAPFSGGYQGARPYLPYEQEELSVGQVVKVLVPGSGVAMARVVYTPLGQNSFLLGNNVSVLLMSEPSNMCGNVINVPMSKILLAWPKHNKENLSFI